VRNLTPEKLTYTDYDLLLERAYKQLPKGPVIIKERLSLPKPEVMVSGKRTFILNFNQICDIIDRQPQLVLRYLLKELGARGIIQESMAVIQGEFSRKAIEVILNRFFSNYVVCPACKSPDTKLVKEKKFMFLICGACGAKSPVRPF